MSDSISTHSVGRGFAVSDEIVLSETPRTRTLFRPALHGGGVRGHIVRQKRSVDGSWADTNEINFNQVPPDCGVQIELDTAATKSLFDRLNQLYLVQDQGVVHGDHHFVVGEADEVIVVNDKNKAGVIQALLDQGLSEELWDALSTNDPDVASRLAAGRVQYDREQAIHAIEQGLTEHPGDELFWQQFFEKHHWILQSVFSSTVYLLGSEVYVGGKGPVGRQGRGGVATDFLLADDSTKSFAVVEIKTPNTKLVGSQYRGNHSGDTNEIFSMHSELTGGVVQTRNQISVAVDNFESVLGPGFEHQLNRIHPKGVLIIGSLSGLSARERDSFNHFRHGLHSLTVITYDELLKRLQLLFTSNPSRPSTADSRVDAPSARSDLDEIPF